MNRLLDRLYCGAFADVQPSLNAEGITCVLSLCEQAPEAVPGVKMIHAPISDEVTLPPQTWSELLRALLAEIRDGHTVLVHCRLGVSRAPSLCAAYLAATGCIASPNTALAYVQERRSVANPHPLTWYGVKQWWESVLYVPQPGREG